MSLRDIAGRVAMAVLAIVVSLAVAPAVMAGPVTIATFEDPSNDESTPLFSYNAGTSQLTGSWLEPGLTLNTIGGTFENARFAVAVAPGVAEGSIGGGRIDFWKSTGETVLSIEFSSADVSVLGFGATEFMNAHDVTITGSILPGALEQESFSFPFSNPVAVGEGGSFTATAAFTSSGVVVPEPGTLLLLGLGSLVVLRRRGANELP